METIKQYIEQNLVDFYLSFKNENDYYENSNIHNINGQQGNWPSFVLLKNHDTNLDKIINFLTNKRLSKNWLLDENFAKKNANTLKDNKFYPIKNWIGMSLKTNKTLPVDNSSSFIVEKLKKQDLKEFIEIVNSIVFKKKILNHVLFIDKLENPNFNFFVGKCNNKIVSTFLIYNNGNTNGLYFLATKTDFRKRGFGGVIFTQAINSMINKGENNFILHGTKMGNNIYKKIGFKIYSKLIIFTKI